LLGSGRSDPLYSRRVPASWIFVRGLESIRIEHRFCSILIIAGPRQQREQRRFEDDEALHAFRSTLTGKLLAEGWFLLGADYERRRGVDRRRTPRGTPERRHIAFWP